MVLTEIGEVGVHIGDDVYTLRPSLAAMVRIGSPERIVDTYARVMAEPAVFLDALHVVYACTDQDVSDVFGYYEEGDGKMVYQPGAADPDDVVALARCLLKHGVTGALPPLPIRDDGEPQYSSNFDAREYASMAIAHLGASSAEAWAMTMTELVGALRAKFPPRESDSPGARAPSPEHNEQTMAWYEQVQAKRKKAKGLH